MRELIEVHQNARSTSCEVKLTQAQIERGLAKPKTKTKKKGELVPKGYHVVADKPEKKKKRNNNGGRRQQDETMMAFGAAAAAAFEVFVMRNPDFAERIPPQLRRYSGLAMAFLGWGLNQMKGVKADMRAFYKGFMAGGVYLAVSDEMVKARKEQLISEAQKIMEEALKTAKALEGLGSMHQLPHPTRLTAGQMMSNLGQQTRVPFHPHGMGEFIWEDDAGLGSIVNLPQGVTRNPNEMGLGGMGEIVETDGGWAGGQVAFSTDQDDIWGTY